MNIILILADDVGAETVGVYGGESYQTPNLDQLARDGVRFDHGHAQPLCTPSRVKIMTGKYNFRNYTHFGFLNPTEKTFAHLLGDAGYNTAVVGKWQLYNNVLERELQGSLPSTAGFEEYLLWQVRHEQRSSRYWGPLLDHDGELRQHGVDVFGPDVLNDYALDYIERHTQAPFFLYYPMVLAHDPWVTTPDMRDESATDQEKFAAMMAYMDKMVGKVRAMVEQQGIADRTVIIFIGDNGTGRGIVSRQNGRDVPGGKGTTLNTGSHVPFVAWGPGVVAPDGESSSLVNLNDILPTLAELAGIAVPAGYSRDGVSLVPVMGGETGLERRELFIHYEPRWNSAPARYAFDQRWKLYENGEFYDMRADPLQKQALPVNALEAEATAAHQRLQDRIESMPGELGSRWGWVPAKYYIMFVAGLVVLSGLLGLGWYLFARRQR
jgi:arylsulfatase A-like enzyme